MIYKFDKENKVVVCDVNNVDDCLEMIWAIGADYDGCNDTYNLKKLIDELVMYAEEGKQYLSKKKYTYEDTKEETDKSYEQAMKEQEEFLKNG